MQTRPMSCRFLALAAGLAVATASAQMAPDTSGPAPAAPEATLPVATAPQAAPATHPASAPASPARAPRTRRVHHFGAAAGFVSGYGLSYRHWSRDSRTGFQATAIPVAHVDEDETYLNLSVGALRLHSLHESRLTNFFAYYGAHYMGYHREWYGDESHYSRDDEDGQFLIAGGGTGMEVLLWDRSIVLSLMFGYAANNSWEKLVDYATYDTDATRRRYDREWQWSFTMHPSIEAGIFYAF